MKSSIATPFAASLFQRLLDRIPVSKSGAYNQADPTAFSKGGILTNVPLRRGAVTFPRIYVNFVDCTWGVEFEFWSYNAALKRKAKKLASVYLDRTLGIKKSTEIVPRKGWSGRWFKVIHQIIRTLPEIVESDYSEDPMGSISRYA